MALSPVLAIKPKTEAAILPKKPFGSFGMILVDTELRIRTLSIQPVLHAPGKADSGGLKGKTCEVATVCSPPIATLERSAFGRFTERPVPACKVMTDLDP